jgi:hypothetical protein
MKLVGLAALSALAATPVLANPAESWLQSRLDIVAAAARVPDGTTKVRIVDARQLSVAPAADGVLRFPAALLAAAPDRDSVDGMLAVLLSNARPRNNAKPSALARDVLGTAAFIGGAVASNDNVPLAAGPAGETEKQVQLSADLADRDRRFARSEREARIIAARALTWTQTAGSCPASLVGWLRSLAVASQGQAFDGVTTARHLLIDLGSSAGDPGDGCTPTRDAAFEAARENASR